MPSWATMVRNGSTHEEEEALAAGVIDKNDSTTTSSRETPFDPANWTSVEQPSTGGLSSQRTTVNEKRLALFLFQQHKHDPRLWTILHPELKLDRDLVEAALEGECVQDIDADLPDEIKRDQYFWRRLIRKNSRWWIRIPRELASDISMAQSMKSFHSRQQVETILQRFPTLQADSSFWLSIVSSGYTDADLITELASPEVLQDKKVMLAAVTENFSVFDVLSAPLNQDRDLVQAALRSSFSALLYIPAFVQRMYPELIAEAIGRSSNSEVLDWNDYVANELWSNRNVALAWASIGGDYSTCAVDFRPNSEATRSSFSL